MSYCRWSSENFKKAADRLLRLRKRGFYVPQYAIDALQEEAADALRGEETKQDLDLLEELKLRLLEFDIDTILAYHTAAILLQGGFDPSDLPPSAEIETSNMKENDRRSYRVVIWSREGIKVDKVVSAKSRESALVKALNGMDLDDENINYLIRDTALLRR